MQAEALTEARTEFGGWFDAIEKHPRLLVGQKVPRADGGEGFETLKDSEDAKEWQEAVKMQLVREVNSRATKKMESTAGIMQTLHSSIELFQNNHDLIPGTVKFDRTLADRVTTLLEPYEVRADGKLQGYSIPTQPLINQVRTQIAAEKAAAVAAATPAPPAASQAAGAPAAAATGAAAAEAAAAAEPPQAGIQSKAGNGEQPEDFSTLFGTLGVQGLRF